MALREITPAPYNPRRDLRPGDPDYELLKKGITEFGCVEPLVWNKRTGRLVGGHQRLKVLRDLGVEFVEVSVVDLDEPREAALNIALNKISGTWDYNKLRDVISELDVGAIDIELTGWRAPELEDLFKKPGQVKEDGFNAAAEAEKIKNPVTKSGDLWLLGKHRLLCGDARDLPAVERLMDRRKARMVFTDPPYNVDYKGGAGAKKGRRQIANDAHKSKEAFYQFLYDSIAAFRPFVTGDVYICMTSSELHTLQKAFVDCGGHWSTFIMWVKSSFTLGRSNYQRQYEPILYGWFEGSSHYWSGVRDLGDVYKEEIRTDEFGRKWVMLESGIESSVWEFPKPKKNDLHPTMKPVALCARGIRNSCLAREVVLDTFGGSGTTAIACEQLDRSCFMMELDPVNCDVIVKRWEQFTGKKAERYPHGGSGAGKKAGRS